MHDPRAVRGLLRDELDQRRTSGYDVSAIAAEVSAALAGEADDDTLRSLYRRLEQRPRRNDWAFDEPAVEAWAALVADGAASAPGTVTPATRRGDPPRDRILGAWLGRCAGCLLGKPIETWTPATIRSYLERHASWPPDEYLPRIDPWPADLPEMKPSWPRATRGRIHGMTRDDDIDYTILGLHVLESHGLAFTTDDVADELLDHLPFTQVFTAERIAYRNLVAGLTPPATATYRNPYREWIGALIRADIFGYVSPGDPRQAAELALRDARLSHDRNGVYGAMWAAATIAAALAGSDARASMLAGMVFVPPASRLAECIGGVIESYDRGATWEGAYDMMHARWGGYPWVHVINNSAAICAALLWGGDDFGRVIGLAVAAGWDTDSAAATAGSVAGAIAGAQRLPARWIDPLEDRVETAVAGFAGSSITALADRTIRVVTAGVAA